MSIELTPLSEIPSVPEEGTIYADAEGQFHIYMDGDWRILEGYHTPQLHLGEQFDSCIKKHQKTIESQALVIKALLKQVTTLQHKVQSLEKIVEVDDRFRNIAWEENGEEDG